MFLEKQIDRKTGAKTMIITLEEVSPPAKVSLNPDEVVKLLTATVAVAKWMGKVQ